jgi:hypothetical protein
LGWTLFFMLVILKIPLFAALYLIWYAVKEEPAPEEEGTGEERGPRRRLPPLPRWPRRGPIDGGDCKVPPCPEREPQRTPAYAGKALARRN